MFKQSLTVLLIFAFFIFAYIKYIEKRGIYYPIKEISLTPADMGIKFEDIYFNTADGLRLNGWFIPSENPRGTVLFCHGNAGNISHRLEKIILLRNLGLNIFIIDYRGYGRSRGSPSEKGIYLDAQAAYDYLIDIRRLPPEDVILYGESLGNGAVVYLAAEREIGALIAEGAFTRGRDMAKRIYPFLPAALFSNSFDNLSRIVKVKAPKLFIHSRDDEVVPFKLSERLFAAASSPKEFYQMRGGHNEAVFMAPEEFRNRIDTFLKKYLR